MELECIRKNNIKIMKPISHGFSNNISCDALSLVLVSYVHVDFIEDNKHTSERIP